ncbi:hypothetical protein [Streptomyces sp. C8S0]|nr:hypothetical protein [Streptomyces sp. C8S0]
MTAIWTALTVLAYWTAIALTAGALIAVIGYRLKKTRPTPPRRRCDRP